MRQISILARQALMNRRKFKRDNTEVEVHFDGATTMRLFGNLIAAYNKDGVLSIGDGNHQTVTTKDRLNALPHVSIYQRNFQWYLNDEKWDGGWTVVHTPFRKRITPEDDTVEEEIL